MRRSSRAPGSLRGCRRPLACSPAMRELRAGRGARPPFGASPAGLIKEAREKGRRHGGGGRAGYDS